jgi:hypothetical protein
VGSRPHRTGKLEKLHVLAIVITTYPPEKRDKVDIENDFQEKCRNGAKFAAHAAFWAIFGEIIVYFRWRFSPAFEADRFNHSRTSPEKSVVSTQLPVRILTPKATVIIEKCRDRIIPNVGNSEIGLAIVVEVAADNPVPRQNLEQSQNE